MNFEPKGMGHANEPYYLAAKENRCVVCGAEESLTKHHCVPYCFRRWFPQDLKRFSSHDILPVCIPCHTVYESWAWELKKELFLKATGQTLTEWGKEQRRESVAANAAYVLMNYGVSIPPDRIDVLRKRIINHLGREPSNLELSNLSTKRGKRRKKYSLGEVMGRSVIEGTTDLYQFMKIWREHFVATMNPQYLPKHWDVNHLLEK